MQNDVIKIGLIGIGKMGQNHLRNLAMLKKVEIAFIYDFNKEACEKMSVQYGVKASTNLEEDLKNVDGIIIVTPTFTHAEYIRLASNYVKNIFVEKPLTDSLTTSNEIVKLAKEKNLNIQVGFIERYNSAVLAFKNVANNSKQVINVDFSRTNKLSSRITDVDVVIDLMIHDIDLALHINGKYKSIHAHGFIKDNMIEYARAILVHENGSYSNIVASRITEKRIRHIAATCEDMYIDCNLLSKEVFVSKQSIEQYLENVSISSKSETIDIRPQEGLLMELVDFVKLCQGEKVRVPNEIDGLLAMQAASEIQKQIIGMN
jgi:predicted dehydrogenase